MLIDEFKLDVITEYKSGDTMHDLGRKYDCNPETVKRRLVEWGVDIRSKNWFFVGKRKSPEHQKRLREQLERIRPLAIAAVKAGKRRTYKGEANPKWKGGTIAYWKQKVLARDGRKCQKCGYDIHPEIIEAHHKDMNHNNNVLDNGIALCPNCHRIIHFQDLTFSTKLRSKRYG